MELYEYLEEVTATIPSNAEARGVRQELASHLRMLQEELVGQGLDAHAAWQEAMRRLGPPAVLQDGFRGEPFPLGARDVRWQVIGAVLAVPAALTALGGFVPGLVVALLATLVIVFHGGDARSGQRVGSMVQSWLHRSRGVVAVAVWSGFLIGAEPIWAAGAVSPWHVGTYGPVVAVLSWVAAMVLTGWTLWRNPKDVWVVATLNLVATALAGIVTVYVMTSAYPVAPSPDVDWYRLYGTLGSYGAIPWYASEAFQRTIGLSGIAYLGTAALGALMTHWEAWRRTVITTPRRAPA